PLPTGCGMHRLHAHADGVHARGPHGRVRGHGGSSHLLYVHAYNAPMRYFLKPLSKTLRLSFTSFRSVLPSLICSLNELTVFLIASGFSSAFLAMPARSGV